MHFFLQFNNISIYVSIVFVLYVGIESFDIETPVNENVLEEYLQGYSDAKYIVKGFKS